MGQSATELKQEIADTRQQLGATLDAIGDRVSPGRMVERRRNRIIRTWHDVRDRVMGTTSSMTDSVTEAGRETADQLGHAPEFVRERTAGNPLMAGAVAFGVGALVAVAVPPSRAERRHASEVGERLEPVKRELGEAAREVADELREPAKAAAQEVQQAATTAAGTVRDEAASSG